MRIWTVWKGCVDDKREKEMKMLGKEWHGPKQTLWEQDILLWTEMGRLVPKGSERACLQPCVTHFSLQNNILVHNLRGKTESLLFWSKLKRQSCGVGVKIASSLTKFVQLISHHFFHKLYSNNGSILWCVHDLQWSTGHGILLVQCSEKCICILELDCF